MVVDVDVFRVLRDNGMVGVVDGGGVVTLQGNGYLEIKFFNPINIPTGLPSHSRECHVLSFSRRDRHRVLLGRSPGNTTRI